MKKNDQAMVVSTAAATTAIADLAPPPIELAPNPFAEMYISGLDSPDSRPAQRSGLDAVARIMTGLPDDVVDRTNFPWHAITILHMRTLRAQLIDLRREDGKRRYGERSINRMLSAVKGTLRACWEAQRMSTDQYTRAISVKGLSTKNLAPAGRAVLLDEINRLLRAAATLPAPQCYREHAMVITMYAGGLRRQECSALDVPNYDPATGAILVLRGKRNKTRTAYLRKEYQEWLAPWVSLQRERGAVPMFVRLNRGEPTDLRLSRTGVDKALRELADLAGVAELTPHDLRRSFATELLENGADILMVQQLMGHADVKTTAIYDRRGEKGKQAAVQKFPVAMRYDELRKPRR